MRQIFVSYVKEDEAFVTRLVDDLAQSGANVWLDIRNARPGRHWTRSIEQALSESAMMIVVLSRTALQSAHVAVEWQAYLEAYRPVIPVLVEACDPPGPLRTRRPIDFTREFMYRRAFHELSLRMIEYGTRIRRSEPVVWNGRRLTPEGQTATPPQPAPARLEGITRDELMASSIRRMVHGLREMLRRSDTPADSVPHR